MLFPVAASGWRMLPFPTMCPGVHDMWLSHGDMTVVDGQLILCPCRTP
jgi:hypothetical protein